MELKTIEKIGKKIISLFNKKRVSLVKDKNDDLFYLILKITIIDEDKEILIPLNKNDNIQVSTINYLLREAKEIKKEFDYKNEIKNKIKKELNDINILKKENEEYLNIINKIKNESKIKKLDDISDDEEEDKNNKIIDNKNNDNINYNIIVIDNCSLETISFMIIEQNERYKKMIKKMNKMENTINLIKNNFKCEAGPKNVILNVDINYTKPYILIHF